jgi:cell division protein FtsB
MAKRRLVECFPNYNASIRKKIQMKRSNAQQNREIGRLKEEVAEMNDRIIELQKIGKDRGFWFVCAETGYESDKREEFGVLLLARMMPIFLCESSARRAWHGNSSLRQSIMPLPQYIGQRLALDLRDLKKHLASKREQIAKLHGEDAMEKSTTERKGAETVPVSVVATRDEEDRAARRAQLASDRPKSDVTLHEVARDAEGDSGRPAARRKGRAA